MDSRSRAHGVTASNSLGWPAARPLGPALRAISAIGLLGLVMLPPVNLALFGRGGALFPIELCVPFAACVVLWRRRFQFRACASLIAFLLYLAACLPSTFAARDLGRHAYGFLVFGIAALLLYVVTAARPERRFLDDLIRFSPIPFVILATVVLGTAWAHGLFAYSGQRKMVTVYGGSNFLASILLLGAYAPLGVAIAGAKRSGRFIGLAAFALMAAAVMTTGSRMGMVLLPVGAVLTVILLHRERQAGGARIAIAALAFSVVLLLLAPYLAAMLDYGRFRDLLGQRNWLVRLALFELYGQEFLASPWIGHGLLGVRLTPALTALGEGRGEGWGGHVGAHNWLLQNLADAGILGALGFVFFLMIAARTFLAVMTQGTPERRLLPHAAGWVAGFAIILLHGLFEPNFHGKPFIYLFVLQLGLAEQVLRLNAPARPFMRINWLSHVLSRTGPARAPAPALLEQ